MTYWAELLAYKKLIAPTIIRILFWVAAAAAVLAGIKTAMTTNNLPGGLAIMILGPILARAVTECLLVPFMIHEKLNHLPEEMKAKK